MRCLVRCSDCGKSPRDRGRSSRPLRTPPRGNRKRKTSDVQDETSRGREQDQARQGPNRWITAIFAGADGERRLAQTSPCVEQVDCLVVPRSRPVVQNRCPICGPCRVSVRISGPVSVISSVCSNCADSDMSRVRTVQ